MVKQHTAAAYGVLLLTLQMTCGKMCIEAKHLSTPECQIPKEQRTDQIIVHFAFIITTLKQPTFQYGLRHVMVCTCYI